MKQTIGEALEVPGHVIMIEPITKKAAIQEANEILDKYEGSGSLRLRDIPENEDKDRLRTLFRALGLDVRF